jgi:large subunit ribosomal protein L25
MSDVDVPVKLTQRVVLGKGLNKLRGGGEVPAVIHNHGQESIHVMAPETELLKAYRAAGKHHPLNLVVGDSKYLALIKDAHFDPVKRQLQHVVFQAIRQDEKVEAEVPVRIEGEIPAEKVGLIVLHQLDSIEIEALPKDLPDEFVVSGEKLIELHDKITVEDLDVPAGVTILTEADHPIATVAETRAQAAEEAEVEAVEGEEGAEGETAEGGETAEASESSSQDNSNNS